MPHIPNAIAPPDGSARRRFLAAMAGALGLRALLARPRAARAATLGADPYIGEIMLFAGNFAPLGWQFCDGSLLPIAIYDTLFSVIGTTYGGDGVTTFAVPDLRGRIPNHMGTGPGLSTRTLGEMGGSERTTLLVTQLPAHRHPALCQTTAGTSNAPAGLLPARDGAGTLAWGPSAQTSLAAGHIGLVGSSLSHENRTPTLALNFCIATEGIYPPRP